MFKLNIFQLKLIFLFQLCHSLSTVKFYFSPDFAFVAQRHKFHRNRILAERSDIISAKSNEIISSLISRVASEKGRAEGGGRRREK